MCAAPSDREPLGPLFRRCAWDGSVPCSVQRACSPRRAGRAAHALRMRRAARQTASVVQAPRSARVGASRC